MWNAERWASVTVGRPWSAICHKQAPAHFPAIFPRGPGSILLPLQPPELPACSWAGELIPSGCWLRASGRPRTFSGLAFLFCAVEAAPPPWWQGSAENARSGGPVGVSWPSRTLHRLPRPSLLPLQQLSLPQGHPQAMERVGQSFSLEGNCPVSTFPPACSPAGPGPSRSLVVSGFLSVHPAPAWPGAAWGSVWLFPASISSRPPSLGLPGRQAPGRVEGDFCRPGCGVLGRD